MKQITQRKNRNRIIASLLFTLFLITGIILFLSRTKEDFGRQPTTSVLYKLSDIYTAGSIFDRNHTLIAKGLSVGQMQWNEDNTIRQSFSNIIGAPIKKTSASCYSVLGMAAPTLYGYHKTCLDDWKQWIFPQSKNGEPIYLTIDVDIQSAIYHSTKQFDNAVVTVSNYQTGEILGMVSLPTFDPTDPDSIVVDKNGFIDTTYHHSCYINKNLQTSFLPGSTIKPILLGIALDINPDLVNMTYNCKKTTHNFHGISVGCYDGEYHGKVDFESALCCSCNGYPIQLLSQIEESDFEQGLLQLGLDSNETYPNRFAAVGSTFYGNGEHDIANRTLATIGQANCRMTVWYLTSLYAAIFNDGIWKNPTIFHNDPNQLGKGNPEETLIYTKNTASILKKALIAVTKKGTAAVYDMSSLGFTIAGKTGTADTASGKRTVWAVAGIIDNQKPYVITVCLPDQREDASGSTVAGPVMREILLKLLQK